MPRSRSSSSEQRRQKKRAYDKKKRDSETQEEADEAREKWRKRKQITRSQEGEEEKKFRMELMRKQQQEKRAKESEEESKKRKETLRKCKKEKRAKESEEESKKRKETLRKYDKEKRAKESEEESKKRKETLRMYDKEKRAKESEEESKKRKETLRIYGKEKRAKESKEESQKRKETLRMYDKEKRAKESEEESQKRKEMMKSYVNEKRSKENEEDGAKRKAESARRMKEMRQNTTKIDINDAIHKFQEKIKVGPIYVCTVCHRMMYRECVVHCDVNKYTKPSSDMHNKVFSKEFEYEVDNKLWICTTCHKSLKKGNMPSQAKANNLTLTDVPDELNDLRPLELRLISQRIPFMKMVGLPKGKQKAIHGPAINVPTSLDSICSLLPRLPHDAQIIPMKLKRKLVYKGHYLYEYIRPERVMRALAWLRANNPLYKDVSVCDDWEAQWEGDDKELWEALIQSEFSVVQKDGETRIPSDVCALQNDGEKCVVTDVRVVQNGGETCVQSDVSIVQNDCEKFETKKSKRVLHCDKQISLNNISNDYSGMQQVAKHYGFEVIDVPGDGNCFFHAVSSSLNAAGIQTLTGPRLKQQLVMYMKSADVEICLRDFLTGPDVVLNSDRSLGVDGPVPEEVDMLIAEIRNPDDRKHQMWCRHVERLEAGAWATNVEVQAMANLLGVRIHVIGTLTPDWVNEITPRNGENPGTVFVGLIQQTHYVALERKNHVSAASTAATDYDEDKEDQEAFEEVSKLRGLPYETCLQKETSDPSDDVFSVAPGEGQHPMPFLTDTHFEELSNPSKYPTGAGGFSMRRPITLQMRRYFNQRILDIDGRFAKDIEYLLAAQYTVESKQVNSDLSIALRQTIGRSFHGKVVTAGIMKDKANVTAMIKGDAGYKFLKNVRGSPAYWQRVFYDVLAMVRQLGIPTWFMTLSAADMQWPEVVQIIARQYGRIVSVDDVKSMSWDEKCVWLRSNPVTAARQFQYRIETFFKEFLCSSADPVGHITDFKFRIEFQARGSPHAHIIIWVHNAPKIGAEGDDVVCEFIDKYQTCSLPDSEELRECVQHVQTHVHSPTCRRFGSCRFKFPHPPSAKTLIAQPPEDEMDQRPQVLERQQKILAEVKKLLVDPDVPADITLEELLVKANVTLDVYSKALASSKSGKRVILKRKPAEKNINQYNEHILKAWKGNMDLQFIIDAYSCVAYVTSYMMKSERSMSELLRKVSKEAERDEIKCKLRKLGSTFLNHREVSAQEAAYRLLSLPLQKGSRKVVFINTSPPEKRVSLLKPVKQIEQMRDDEENVFCSSLLERYSARPTQLNDICLAEFAANYTADPKDYEDRENDHQPNMIDEPDVIQEGNKIKLQRGLGTMHKRKREAIIRFYKEKKGELKYRSMIMLYQPWRHESVDLLAGCNSYQEHFNLVKDTVLRNERKYSFNEQEIEDALEYVDLDPVHAWDQLAPGAEQEEAEAAAEGFVVERDVEIEEVGANVELVSNKNVVSELQAKFTIEARKTLLTGTEYREMMRGLNSEQRTVIQHHRKWCKDVVHCLQSNLPLPRYHLFLSGSGGVGKSYVIKLIHYDTMRLLRLSQYFEPDDIPVMLTAPTGTAAFNIDGMTLHSAFCFQVGPSKEYKSLGADKANTVRSRLEKCKLLIIDEVSMVGADMLYHIHLRLEEIAKKTENDSRFGDVSILAVGDLYQLQPVRQNHVFGLPSDDFAKVHGSLWEENFKMLELTQSVRQQGDQRFAELLCRVRTATCTDEDIALLKSRGIDQKSPSYPRDALHVFTTNMEKDEHNERYIRELGVDIVTSMAVDYKKDRQTGQVVVIAPSKASDTGGLRSELKVAVGARVMLIVNVNVTDGLVNGACGTVVHIVMTDNDMCKILVAFDSERVGKEAISNSEFKVQFPYAVPIHKHEATYSIGRGRGSVQASRRQFPLTLAWACTIHKVQGMTLDEIVVSLSGRFMPGQAYVACSRVRTLSGLFILNFDVTKIKASVIVKEEMKRLSKLKLQPLPAPQLVSIDEKMWVSVGFLNVRSYTEHFRDLCVDDNLKNIGIMCFAETFLTAGHIITEVQSGMTCFRADRDPSRGLERGGLMIVANKQFQPMTVDVNDHGLEICTVCVTIKGKQVLVIALYKRPVEPKSAFVHNVDRLLCGLDKSQLAVIVGDFNVDLLQCDKNELLLMCMERHGFKQHVSKPTHDSGSLIDHIYTNFMPTSMYIDTIDCYYSDHDIVAFSFLPWQ